MKVETKEYYIAYFDILGYKNFFEDKENDINEFLNYNINLVDDVMNNTTKNTRIFNYPFTLKMFSDNFVILVKKNKNIGEFYIVKILTYMLAILQLRFLEKYRILIRGCITCGEVYVDDRILFGEGLIRAVEQESYSNFPRIIIDKERIAKSVCEDLCKYFVKIDEDDEYYIDFFNVVGSGVDNGKEIIDDKEKQLNLIRKNIVALVKKHGKYKRNVKDTTKIHIAEKTISKYAWLLCKYNIYCEDGYERYKIPYKLNLYYRLMKCEIEV